MKSRHRLTAHFTVEEFDSKDGARVPTADHRALELLCRWWLEPLRLVAGPVVVHSGFRSAAHNRAVHGARRSVHLLTTRMIGLGERSTLHAAAADVTTARLSPAEVAAWARRHRAAESHLGHRGRGGIGRYGAFTHLDSSVSRDWDG